MRPKLLTPQDQMDAIDAVLAQGAQIISVVSNVDFTIDSECVLDCTVTIMRGGECLVVDCGQQVADYAKQRMLS